MSDIQDRIAAIFEQLKDAAAGWIEDCEDDQDFDPDELPAEGWQRDWGILVLADCDDADFDRFDLGEKALALLAEIAGQL